ASIVAFSHVLNARSTHQPHVILRLHRHCSPFAHSIGSFRVRSRSGAPSRLTDLAYSPGGKGRFHTLLLPPFKRSEERCNSLSRNDLTGRWRVPDPQEGRHRIRTQRIQR